MNVDMEKRAIERLKAYAPVNGDSYYLCYSGGKDSDCCRILAGLAGVPYELHYCHTSVDAPETIYYIRSIPNVIVDYPTYPDGKIKTMFNLIPFKKIPPTRLIRWCCVELKEWAGKGRLKITGVRYDESVRRSQLQGEITIQGKPVHTKKMLDSLGLDYSVNKLGGILLSYDNDTARNQADFLHSCFKSRSISINPIVDWSDNDVWEFLKFYGCSANPLYQSGCGRIGCIGCPLSGSKGMERDFYLYPKYKENYIRAFDRMVKRRLDSGLTSRCSWNSGEEVFNWWIEDDTIPNQLSFFDDPDFENDFYNAMV